MVQEVECLPSQHKVLRSNPSTSKKKKVEKFLGINLQYVQDICRGNKTLRKECKDLNRTVKYGHEDRQADKQIRINNLETDLRVVYQLIINKAHNETQQGKNSLGVTGAGVTE
jgi:hypothetical protein